MQELSCTNHCGLTRIKFDKWKESSSLSLSATSFSLFMLCFRENGLSIQGIHFLLVKFYTKSVSVLQVSVSSSHDNLFLVLETSRLMISCFSGLSVNKAFLYIAQFFFVFTCHLRIRNFCFLRYERVFWKVFLMFPLSLGDLCLLCCSLVFLGHCTVRCVYHICRNMLMP